MSTETTPLATAGILMNSEGLTNRAAYVLTLVVAGVIAVSLAAASIALALPWLTVIAALTGGAAIYTAAFGRAFRDEDSSL